MKKISFALVGAFLSLFAAGTAGADETKTEDADRPAPAAVRSRVIGQGAVTGLVNPAIVQLDAGVSYRHVVSTDERTDNEKAYLQAGAGFRMNQIYAGHSVHGEWRPAPLFTLRLEYELLGFPGTSRSMVSFADKGANFGESVLENADARSGVMHKVMIAPMLQSRFGPIILRNKSKVAYYHATTAGPYFYEPQHDTLIAKDDVVIQGRTELLYEAWRGGRDASIAFGPVYEMTRAIRTETSRQRLGGLLAVTFADAIGPVYRPGFFVEAGSNLEDRNREQQAYASFGIKMDWQ